MLFLRGLWWRRGFTVAVLLVGAVSAAVAAIGPLYARAAGESTLTDDLRAAGSATGLAYSTGVRGGDPGAVDAVTRRVAARPAVRGYGPPIRGESLALLARAPGDGASTPTTMVWRSGQCGQLVIVRGRCATRPGDVLVPEAAVADSPGWRPGEPLTFRELIHAGPDNAVAEGADLGRAIVVGSYRPRNADSAYWFALPYFAAQTGAAANRIGRVGIDPVFVVPQQFAQVDPLVSPRVDVDVPLHAGAVRLDDVPRLRREVAAAQRAFPLRSAAVGDPTLRTGLPHALDVAARDRRAVDDATLVVVLELSLLSLLVLFQVVSGAVAARSDEIALAKLRGLRPWRTVVFALGEPVAVLACAAPLGFAAGSAVTHAMVSGAFVRGTPVAVTAATGWALLAAFAGGAVAAALAAVRTLTRPVLEQWRNTTPRPRDPRPLLVVEAAVAAAAIATVVGLRAGGSTHPRPVFLLGPALLVLAVGLVGVRFLPRLAALGLRPTRASRSVAAFLALRRTVRRPGGLRLATLLAVATGLAVFAICGEAVAAANRTARARTELGANRQLAVQFETAHDPQAVVDRVDPHGRWALAAASWMPDGGPPSGSTVTGPLLGLEAGRLPQVAYRVRGQLSPGTLAAVLAPGATPPPATFTGTALQVTVEVSELSGDRPALDLLVRRGAQQPMTVHAGTLAPGRHTYAAPLSCTAGCRFAGFVVDRSVDAADRISGRFRLESLLVVSGATTTPVSAALAQPASWRGGEIGYGAAVTTQAAGTALEVGYTATGGSSPKLVYADSPPVVPFAAAPRATTTPGLGRGAVADFSGASLSYRVRLRVSPLPVALDTGALANLDYLRSRLPGFDREATWSVWLGPHAPADAVARLRHAGLLVQNVRTESARVHQLGRQGPALGLLLLLVCAIAAAVLAVGATAVAVLADARSRLFELAALRVIGVPARTLRRSAVAEQALLLGAAFVLGVPAGYAAAALVLPAVPEFSDPTPTVLRFHPPVALALTTAAGFAVLLTAAAVVAGVALTRSADPGRLRGASR